MRTPRFAASVAVTVVLLTSCGASSVTGDSDEAETVTTADLLIATSAFSERLDDIGDAVETWRNATSLAVAHAAAERALNLIVGPNGPGYGDNDGGASVSGEPLVGLLPGADGAPAGLSIPLAGNDCVVRDVLGGSWADPGMRWDEMLSAIDDWRRDNNTMPTLASHPMRVVGWATFTLNSDSLDEAHEYAGHADLHVNISRRALDC